MTHNYFGPWLNPPSKTITDAKAMIYNVMQPKTNEECAELDALVEEAGVKNGMALHDPEVVELILLTDKWKEIREK